MAGGLSSVSAAAKLHKASLVPESGASGERETLKIAHYAHILQIDRRQVKQ
jgi:hypothetical protein